MYRDVVHYLTEDYAEEEVNVQRIEQLYRMTGDLTLTGFNGFTTSVKEFQAFEWELNAQLESGNHFVSDSAILSSMPELTKVIKTPLLPNSAELGDICTLRNGPFIDYQARVVSFGKRTAPFSGTGFHAHIRSLSELIEGRKHWVIFPPNQVPASGFNPFENLADWREHVFPTLLATDAAPIEIIQEAGQVVYIPEGWYHATQTLSESSLSIRYQPREVEPGSYYYYLVKGDQRAASDDYAAAAKLYRLGLAVQKDAVLYTRLGDALERLGQLTEAEEAYKEGLYCNPRDPYIYAMLVTFFVTHAKKDTSASVGELLQNAATYGLKEMVLKLMNDSL